MSRRHALTILLAVSEKQATLKEAFASIDGFSNHPDKSFISEICYGVCRYYHQLSFVLDELMDKPLKAKYLDVRLILLMGIYQIEHMQTPDYAVVNESVKLAKKQRKNWATGLVNATLRRYIDNREGIAERINKNPLSRYSLPEWLYQRLADSDSDGLDSLLEALLGRALIYLRVNQLKISTTEYLKILHDEGIKASLVEGVESAIVLSSPTAVTDLPHFAEGFVSVQDIAPMQAAPLLSVKSGEKVLDLCTAPGGKLCHLLERHPDADITGFDVSSSRMETVKENLARLHLSATLLTADALEADKHLELASFDKILLDAPCTATGVIRRHPEIKLLRHEEDVEIVVNLQQAILAKAWTLLKPGCQLLYCTCSLLQEENDKQIKAFLDEHKSAELKPITVTNAVKTQYGAQCLPPVSDGFYFSLLTKLL